MADFIRIVTAQNLVRIINIEQIVQVIQQGVEWQVIPTTGQPFTLHDSEAQQLFKRLPGMPATASPVR
jgi:hypothetical protein